MSTGRGTRTIGVDEMCRLLPLWLECGGFLSREVKGGGVLRVYGSPRRVGAFLGRVFNEMTLVGGEMVYKADKGFVDIRVIRDGEDC